MAEGRALRDRVQAAITAGYRRLDIEGDNLIVIEIVQGKSAIPWQLKYIIQDIRIMLNQLDHVVVNPIYQEANMAANWLSKYGHSLSGTLLTTECCNPEFRNIVLDDMLGSTLVRRGV